jgi:hypothetical protein
LNEHHLQNQEWIAEGVREAGHISESVFLVPAEINDGNNAVLTSKTASWLEWLPVAGRGPRRACLPCMIGTARRKLGISLVHGLVHAVSGDQGGNSLQESSLLVEVQ